MDGWMDGSGQEQGLPAAPGSLSTSGTAPPLCGLYKKRSPIFRMGGAARFQWLAGLVLEGKWSGAKRLFLAPPGPPPPASHPRASDLWSQNPCCALRSRGRGTEWRLSPGFPYCSLTPKSPSRTPSIHSHWLGPSLPHKGPPCAPLLPLVIS